MKGNDYCDKGVGPNKVILLGGFGWNDIGDEAMPRTVILNLRRESENIDFVMISPNPEYSTRYHGVRAIPEIDFDTCPRIVAKMLGENGVFL